MTNKANSETNSETLSRPGETLRSFFWAEYRVALPDVDRDVCLPCPWHRDSGNSLVLNPRRGTYRCHAENCALQGDLVDLLVVHRRLPIETAVEIAGLRPVGRSRPGREALRLFASRARAQAEEFLGELLSSPCPPDACAMMDCLLPRATPALRAAAAARGFEADWRGRVLRISPARLPDADAAAILLLLRGARREGQQVVVPLSRRRMRPDP